MQLVIRLYVIVIERSQSGSIKLLLVNKLVARFINYKHGRLSLRLRLDYLLLAV